MGTLLDRLLHDETALADVGRIARERARAAGVPSYYRDLTLGPGIVMEMPDGTRHMIDENTREILATFGPRDEP